MTMEERFQTLKGSALEWHTDPEDKPEGFKEILVAYTYNYKCEFENIIDNLYFTDSLAEDGSDRTNIAWAYIDTEIPDMLLQKKIEERNKEETNEEKAERINAKIAELEAAIAELKKKRL